MIYQLNQLKRPVLISTAEVIFHAPTKHTLDERMIENSIIIAEERFIRPMLGSAMYEAMIGQKNLTITESNQAAQQAAIEAAGYAYTLETGNVLNCAGFLSRAYQKLWELFLWKLVAECVAFVSTPEGFIQFGSEGIVHNQPTSSPMGGGGMVTPGLQSVRWAMDTKLNQRIDPLIVATTTFIRANKSDYPLFPFPEEDCGREEPTIIGKRSNFILNVYDDED